MCLQPRASLDSFPYKYILLILYPLAVTQHGVQLALAQADAEHLHCENAVPVMKTSCHLHSSCQVWTMKLNSKYLAVDFL